MKRVIIVEDEALIADHLAMLLEQLGYDVQTIVDNADDLFIALEKETPDIILLDIQIQGHLDGVDITNVLNSRYQIPFVFISSNTDDKTLQRVKHTQPAGFISKPFKPEQLRSVLKLVPDAPSVFKKDSLETHFFVKDGLGHERVAYDDVLYAKADDNYTQLFTAKKRFVLSATLKKTEEQFAPHGFIRCHRSYLVNPDKIDQILGNSVVIAGQEIPVSESMRKNITDRLDLF